MKVVAAVTGLITSEVAALYALRYADLFGYGLVLLHVNNAAEIPAEVVASMEVVEEAAAGYGVECERVFLSGPPDVAIRDYLWQSRPDSLFCSTRMRTSYFENSLSDKLSRLDLPANLAVVRVTRVEAWALTREVVLPILGDKLSVEKFVFFASLVKTLGATAEIYSISPDGRHGRNPMDIGRARELFARINERLTHYLQALKLLEVTVRIKHALADEEITQILHHLSHHKGTLLVVGGRRLSRRRFRLGTNRLEHLFRSTPVNIIAFYARHGK